MYWIAENENLIEHFDQQILSLFWFACSDCFINPSHIVPFSENLKLFQVQVLAENCRLKSVNNTKIHFWDNHDNSFPCFPLIYSVKKKRFWFSNGKKKLSACFFLLYQKWEWLYKMAWNQLLNKKLFWISIP